MHERPKMKVATNMSLLGMHERPKIKVATNVSLLGMHEQPSLQRVVLDVSLEDGEHFPMNIL